MTSYVTAAGQLFLTPNVKNPNPDRPQVIAFHFVGGHYPLLHAFPFCYRDRQVHSTLRRSIFSAYSLKMQSR